MFLDVNHQAEEEHGSSSRRKRVGPWVELSHKVERDDEGNQRSGYRHEAGNVDPRQLVLQRHFKRLAFWALTWRAGQSPEDKESCQGGHRTLDEEAPGFLVISTENRRAWDRGSPFLDQFAHHRQPMLSISQPPVTTAAKLRNFGFFSIVPSPSLTT